MFLLCERLPSIGTLRGVYYRKEVGKAIMGDIMVMKKDLYLLHRAGL